MIRFEDVSIGSFRNLSLVLEAGCSYRIRAESSLDKDALQEGILGERRPPAGRIFVLGEEVSRLEEERRLKLLSRIGLVPVRGGTVSNLKVWENLVLPCWYHRGVGPQEAESRVAGLYEKLGFPRGDLDRYMSRPAGTLSSFETRVVCLVRAMLLEPEIMIYDTLLGGVGREDSARLLEVTDGFHSAQRGRLSVHLSPDVQALEGVRTDRGFHQQGKDLVPWSS